jgi:hypothetical protein
MENNNPDRLPAHRRKACGQNRQDSTRPEHLIDKPTNLARVQFSA